MRFIQRLQYSRFGAQNDTGGRKIQKFPKKVQQVETDDGSLTVREQETNVSYRSLRGAITESDHVFVSQVPLSPVSILELGFGLGTNVSRVFAQRDSVTYVSLEPDPVSKEFWMIDEVFHGADIDTVEVGEHALTIVASTWQEFETDACFDVYFHDPFGPDRSPECWTVECFEWAASRLERDGILTTYGASTAARQAMKDAGFYVGSLPGAPGKREMTVASLTEDRIAHSKPWKR